MPYKVEEFLGGRWYFIRSFTQEPTLKDSPIKSAETSESDMKRKMFVRKNT